MSKTIPPTKCVYHPICRWAKENSEKHCFGFMENEKYICQDYISYEESEYRTDVVTNKEMEGRLLKRYF